MNLRKRRAYSLVELLVVLGIIVLLAGILLPAVGRAREQGKRIRCLSNLRQLTLAWITYANDNKGRICSSETQAVSGSGGINSWVYNFDGDGGGTLKVTASYAGIKNPPNGFWSWIGGLKSKFRREAGVLWPYLKAADVYRCPDDTSPRATSYQINGMLAGRLGTPRTILTTAEIRKPSGTFVFIEGWDATGITPAFYESIELFNSFQSPIHPNDVLVVGGIPGQNHASATMAVDGTAISFADGHAIFWTYTDPRVRNIAEAMYAGLTSETHFERQSSGELKQITEIAGAAANSPDVKQLAAWSGGPIPPGVNQ